MTPNDRVPMEVTERQQVVVEVYLDYHLVDLVLPISRTEPTILNVPRLLLTEIPVFYKIFRLSFILN